MKKAEKPPNYGSLPPFLIISSGNRFGELAFKTHMRSQVFLCRLALQRIWKHFERREDRFQRWRFGVLRQRGLWGWAVSICRDPSACLDTYMFKDGKASPALEFRSVQGVQAAPLWGWRGQEVTLSPGLLCWTVSLTLHSGSFSWAPMSYLRHMLFWSAESSKSCHCGPSSRGSHLCQGKKKIQLFLCDLREQLAQGSLPRLCLQVL